MSMQKDLSSTVFNLQALIRYRTPSIIGPLKNQTRFTRSTRSPRGAQKNEGSCFLPSSVIHCSTAQAHSLRGKSAVVRKLSPCVKGTQTYVCGANITQGAVVAPYVVTEKETCWVSIRRPAPLGRDTGKLQEDPVSPWI